MRIEKDIHRSALLMHSSVTWLTIGDQVIWQIRI